MSVTTLPFIDLYPIESARENWHRAECELCGWYGDGTESSAEEYAADHLEEAHPRRYHAAWFGRIAEGRAKYGLD